MANEGPTTITGEVGATGSIGKRIIDVTPTLGTSIGRSVKSIPSYNLSYWWGDQLANYKMWHVATFSHTQSDGTESIYYLARAEFDSTNGFMMFMKYDSNGNPQFIKQIGKSGDGLNLMPVDMQVDLVNNRIYVLAYGLEVRTAPLESFNKYFVACYNLDFNTGNQRWQRWVGVDDNTSPGRPTSMTLSATGDALYIAGYGVISATISPGYSASFVMALDIKVTNPATALVKPLWFNAYKINPVSQQGQDSNKDITSLFLNFQFHLHAQSFFVNYKSNVIKSKTFIGFWNSYYPSQERKHAINKGEVKLSHKLQKSGYQFQMYYSAEYLLKTLSNYKPNLPEMANIYKIHGDAQSLRRKEYLPNPFLDLFSSRTANSENISHLFATYLTRTVGAPLKLDVLKTGAATTNEVSAALHSKIDESELEDLVIYMQSQGTWASNRGIKSLWISRGLIS
jgi:hypothetical protein